MLMQRGTIHFFRICDVHSIVDISANSIPHRPSFDTVEKCLILNFAAINLRLLFSRECRAQQVRYVFSPWGDMLATQAAIVALAELIAADWHSSVYLLHLGARFN